MCSMALHFRCMTTLNVRIGGQHHVRYYTADISSTFCKRLACILYDFDSGSNNPNIPGSLMLVSEMWIVVMCINAWGGHNEGTKRPKIHFHTKFSLWFVSQTTYPKYGRLFQKQPLYTLRDNWVPVTTAWGVLRVRIEERHPIRRVAANLLNKQSRTADKEWSSRLEIGRGANSSSP
jgi:hypothetical protein